MADFALRLDIDDVTGPGRTGEILVRPLLAGDNGTHWQSDSPGRIPLKYNDPEHAESDPAYDPEYTILGGPDGRWEALIQGAYYEFTVLRVNNTYSRPPETFTAQIPAAASGDFSDLAPIPSPPAPISDLIDDTIAYEINQSGSDSQAAVDTRVRIAQADALQLSRLDRATRAKLEKYNRQALARADDANVITEDWTDASGWVGTSTVSGGRMFGSAAGLVKGISLPPTGRLLMRFLMTNGSAGTTYRYFGITGDAVGVAPSGSPNNVLVMGISGAGMNFIQGANVTGTVSNFSFSAKSADDYICTLAIDETNIMFSVAKRTNPGQVMYSMSILRSQFPGGGTINNLILSTNDVSTTTGSWGPGVIVSDMIPPHPSQQTPGGEVLFGAGNPFLFNRRDPATGIRHLLHVPGDWDPRVPLKTIEHLHWSVTGTGATPFTDARYTNVLAALLAAGYSSLMSDNGPATTAGGTQDKFGNQQGIDDYNAAVLWMRQNFCSGSLGLLGPSQGGEFVENMIASRLVNATGGIAAAALISPSSDLPTVAGLPGFGAITLAAWGVATVPALVTLLQSNGLNPLDQRVGNLAGVPRRWYHALDDALISKAIHIDPIIAKLAGTVPEASLVTIPTGGHLAAALFQGSDLVTFFDKYMV